MGLGSQDTKAMTKFVRRKGGCVPFSDFAKEHLMAPGRGFYSHQVDLSNDHGPVVTPMNYDHAYRAAFAALAIGTASQVARALDLDKVQIVEIGPGGGEFCQELHEAFNDATSYLRQVGSPLRHLSYTAIDPNERHITALRSNRFDGRIGTAQNIPLNGETAHVVIAEEVLDALPYDLYQVEQGPNGQKTITRKAFVELSGPKRGQLELNFRPVDRNEEIQDLEGHVTRIPGAQQQRHPSFYAFSPDYLQVWTEMHRILTHQGVAIVGDYTGMPGRSLLAQRYKQELAAVNDPYRRDLTHLIDADLQAAMAEAAGFEQARALSVTETANKLARALGNPRDQRYVRNTVGVGNRRLICGRRLAARLNSSATSTRSTVSVEELINNNLGARQALAAIGSNPQYLEVLKRLKQLDLRGGQIKVVFSDRAKDDPNHFVQLILREDPNALADARRYPQ
jgi:SAM-dependent MidA family methyltransferase